MFTCLQMLTEECVGRTHNKEITRMESLCHAKSIMQESLWRDVIKYCLTLDSKDIYVLALIERLKKKV